MANNFLEIKNIARQALPRLMENLVFPHLVYKDFADVDSFIDIISQLKNPEME